MESRKPMSLTRYVVMYINMSIIYPDFASKFLIHFSF